MNRSTQIFIANHKTEGGPLRLGQRFVNRYIKEPWPELFHERNDRVAAAVIDKWLTDHHYIHELPYILPSVIRKLIRPGRRLIDFFLSNG